MKKSLTFCIVCLSVLNSSLGFSQQNPPKTTTTTAIRQSFASEKITIDSTSGGKGFTSSVINPTCSGCVPNIVQANAAACSLETGDIRVQTSGVTVTSSTGMYITAGGGFVIYGFNDISAFRAIRVTSTSGIINCTYYR